ncbi:MAG TPA: DUF1801 domain-containing protein [Ilumatobacteraceae bacterium]|nr:DUF1801 domain-containing protein [Ilumatobacteraceae bacterium]
MADKPTDDDAVRDKIAALPAFNDVAARLHEVILEAAPQLQPRLWYGMPGYAMSKKSPVLCFFRVDDDRYVTFGLSEHAHHEPEHGAGHQLMGSAWFLAELDEPTEARIAEIVRRAVA